MTVTSLLITLTTILSLNNFHINSQSKNNVNKREKNSVTTFVYSPIDIGEPNDNINNASSLVEEGFHTNDIYTNSFDTRLDNSLGSSDNDFYYIPVFTNTRMTISVSGSETQNYPFEMYVYTYTYNKNGINDNKACKLLSALREENDPTQKYKTFEADVCPGTYILLIKSDSTIKQRPIIDYHVYLRLEKKGRNSSPRSMGELKYCKGAIGAIWKSDYLPVKNSAIVKPFQCLTYYQEGKSGIEYRDYALEELMRVSNGENIHLATYYLWDGELIFLLSTIFSTIFDCMESNFSNTEKLKVEFELVKDEIGRVTSIGGKITNLLGKFASFSTLTKVGAATFISIFKYSLITYLESLIPTYSYVDYQYFDWLKSYLHSIPNLSEEKQIAYWNAFADNSALIIPIYYKLYVKEDIFPINNKYQIDFSATFEETHNLTTLYHTEDDLPVLVDDDYYCRGNIYGMKYDEDNEIFIEDGRLIPYETINPDILSVGVAQPTPNLHRKQMKWYKFVAEEEGDYSIRIYRRTKDNSYEKYATDCSLNVYNQVYYGYDESHAIFSTNVGFYENDVVIGPYYEAHLEKGQTLYFRINGVNYNSIEECSIEIKNYFANNLIIEQSNHVHNYTNNYVWFSLTKHQSFCACGTQHFEPHVITGSSSPIGRYATCALCHGNASIGIVNGYSIRNNMKYELREDGLYYPINTYISNGNIVLDYEDSISFINNNLNTYDDIIN